MAKISLKRAFSGFPKGVVWTPIFPSLDSPFDHLRYGQEMPLTVVIIVV